MKLLKILHTVFPLLIIAMFVGLYLATEGGDFCLIPVAIVLYDFFVLDGKLSFEGYRRTRQRRPRQRTVLPTGIYIPEEFIKEEEFKV